MFDSVGWGEIVVLVIAGLFILGPERLPEAAAWLGRTIKQVRDYATGATEQLRGEFGPEFDEMRKPLEELRSLRNFNPRTAATRALLGDDDRPSEKPNGYAPKPDQAKADLTKNGSPAPSPVNGGGPRPGGAGPQLSKGETPPIDPDAT